jgi:hypothetical protein
MNSPNSRPDLALGSSLNFEVILKDSSGRQIAGIWFLDDAWKISTDPLSHFSTKAEALEAWETRFDHRTGLPSLRSTDNGRDDKKNSSGG